MGTTAYWSPNQAAIAQVETYTFSAPAGVGNTYNAVLNGKTVTYRSVGGDTAATAATALYNLLNVASGIAAEFGEIVFANPSDAVLTATARVPGTPFANVPGTALGLVLSTGNGLAGGIATAHTVANASPSDIDDGQNWLRVTPPAPGVRQLPQNGDDVVVSNSGVPMLWNADQLAAVRFNTYTRWQSFTAQIGLPENNPNGYGEWRATYFSFSGPAGSVPAAGLAVVLGQGIVGAGPTRERYNCGSSRVTLVALAAGQADDEYGIRFLGVHTQNTFTALGGVSLGIAMLPGETAQLASCVMDGGATVGIGAGVTWTAASTLTCYGGRLFIGAAPATLACNNGTAVVIAADALTWPAITMQIGCSLAVMAGGVVTSLTMATGSSLDKSADGRGLTITNHTVDGTCSIVDPLNAITFTNAGTVTGQVTQGVYQFTGTRTVKVT